MHNRSLLNKLLPFAPFLLLVITFICNVSWNIADHDDGHTLGFHAMGRQANIQRSYGAYDSMCDYLLGLLPINYKILLGCMVGATFLSALSLIYFSGKIIRILFGYSQQTIALGLVAFMVGMPEFLYMIVSFKSVYISLNMVLISFYLLLRANQSRLLWITSALIFGFGVSFRWNMLMCGLPLFLVGIYHQVAAGQSLIKASTRLSIWGLGSLVSALVFITISGYTPAAVVQTYLWGKGYAEDAKFQLMARIGDLSLFVTPLSGALMIIGLFYLLRTNTHRILFLLLFLSSLASIMAVGFAPSFKYLAPLWLGLMLLCCSAIEFIQYLLSKWKHPVPIVLVFGWAVNWFLGIQINTPTSNWGPGLAVKTETENTGLYRASTQTDGRFKLENIQIGFMDGFCLPTSEGMRPLWGHFYALFCGKLNQLDDKLNRETDQIVVKALQTHGTIYQDRINPYLLASYLRYGCSTKDTWQSDSIFSNRTFYKGSDSFQELRINNPQDLYDIKLVKEYINNQDSIYLSFTYTSSLNKFLYLWSRLPNHGYHKLGPLSAIIFYPSKTKSTF